MDDDRMKCPYCDGMLSGSFYKPAEEGGLVKYIFCPDCGFERPEEICYEISREEFAELLNDQFKKRGMKMRIVRTEDGQLVAKEGDNEIELL